MIGTEDYYEENLKGKNQKQIMTVIRSLKQEMGRLKNTMERSDYGRTTSTKPSDSTRLWCTRMYLNRAKQALTQIGGTYSPSKAEQKVERFDASIPAINKVIFSIGGFFGGYETRTITLDEEQLHVDVEHSLILKIPNLPAGLDTPCNKEEFLKEIRELHIGEWRTCYMNNDILDGTQWELTIEFSDGHKSFRTGGSNAYPYNFDAFQKLLGIEEEDDNDDEDKDDDDKEDDDKEDD